MVKFKPTPFHCSMAELSSSMPTSGGLYYVVGAIAPPKIAPFLAYLTGRLPRSQYLLAFSLYLTARMYRLE